MSDATVVSPTDTAATSFTRSIIPTVPKGNFNRPGITPGQVHTIRSQTFPGATPSTGGGDVPNSAADLLKQTLIAWGLASLLPHLQDYLKKGYDSNTINLALQDTQEWKTRFAGNEIRKQNGLSVLSPAQYLAVEEQYHQIMQAHGLPSQFYDKQDDFTKFIGGDVSPSELDARAKIAADQWQNADPATKQAWKNYYNLDDGHAIAAILDQKTALPIIERQAAAAGIGGAAGQQGLDVTRSRAEQFAQFGVSLDQARQAYSNISQVLPAATALGSRFGEQLGQSQLEDASLLGSGEAQRQLQRLGSAEKSDFSGGIGANATTNATSGNY
jgi:hypothetical protein